MRTQEVILRAMSKQISWIQAAEIIGVSRRSMRRWRRRPSPPTIQPPFCQYVPTYRPSNLQAVDRLSAYFFFSPLQQFQETCAGLRHPPPERRGGDFIVLSAEDWSAIEETLFLNRVPGLVESVHEAAAEPLERGTKIQDLKW